MALLVNHQLNCLAAHQAKAACGGCTPTCANPKPLVPACPSLVWYTPTHARTVPASTGTHVCVVACRSMHTLPAGHPSQQSTETAWTTGTPSQHLSATTGWRLAGAAISKPASCESLGTVLCLSTCMRNMCMRYMRYMCIASSRAQAGLSSRNTHGQQEHT
jgi:hypothetical protein